MSTSNKSTFHLRSNSLPSKNHPLTEGVEEQLSRLRESEATSSSVSYKLSALKDLHDSFDDLLHFPLIQQALSNEHYSKCIEESLERSIRLLDVCGTTRDVFSQMKECVQELESSLRRKRCGESSCSENEVGAYMISRKRLNKVISKCFRNLKRTEKKSISIPSVDKDSNLFAVVSMIKEVEEISLLVFESLLSLICRPKARTTGWSAVSKLLQSGRVSCEGQGCANEVEKMDSELICLIGKKSNHVEVQTALMGLKDLECSIQEVEEELECVFRRLLKVRVSLLNTLNH
ncbi:hypothetical protein BDE02_05G212200 [Populus trichocarpa]|jgi:hypothetical protein|nr:hypothetical protein BDE02_05G212200 [Populus trichocarpa]